MPAAAHGEKNRVRRLTLRRRGRSIATLAPRYSRPEVRLGFAATAACSLFRQLVHAALEDVVHVQGALDEEGEGLHQDDAGDAVLGIEPEKSVVDAAPAQAPRGALAGHGGSRDLEAQAPFVPRTD